KMARITQIGDRPPGNLAELEAGTRATGWFGVAGAGAAVAPTLDGADVSRPAPLTVASGGTATEDSPPTTGGISIASPPEAKPGVAPTVTAAPPKAAVKTSPWLSPGGAQ